MTRKKKSSSTGRTLNIETLNHRIMLDGAGFIDPVFYGPTPYLSEADTPAGFVPVPDCDECVVGLETFEDNMLDFDLDIPDGQIIGPGFSTGIENLTDSVDGDDGVIDGTGQTNNRGYSFFSFGNSITVNLPSLMQSAGLVWTDGDPRVTDVVFEAFDENGNSLGTVNGGPIGDNSFTGTTAEDRFFGISYGDGVSTGVTSITITNIGGRGIEIDHVQFANCSACCEIDLELEKSANVVTGEAGDVVDWTIEVTNNPQTATESATGVQIGDVIPAGLTVTSVAISNGSFSPGTGIWTLSDALEPGDSTTLTIQTTIDAGLADGTMLTNTAQVIAADQSDVDSTPNNDDGDQSEDDEDSAKITVIAANQVIDLELNKDVDTTVVSSGDTATWTVSVTNNDANATTAATGVTISDVLPSGVSLVSSTPSGNGSFAGNTWSLNDPLAPGATETLTIVTTVDAGLAGGTMLVNTAFVAEANEPDVDSTPGDNDVAEDDADNAIVTVKSLIDLELEKDLDTTTVLPSGQVQWVLSLTNTADANSDATGVVVQDTLPSGFTIVSANPSGNSVYSNGEWTINEAISPGESLSLSLLGTVDAAVPAGTVLTNVAEVTAADQMDVDSTPSNDDGDQSEDDEANANYVVPASELLSLSGFSYIDTNNDGIFQSNELPLLGVEIQLMGTDLSGNPVNVTTFTNNEGFYQFENLQPGNYMVKQTQPVQFVDGKDTIGNLGGDDSVNDKFTVNLTENAEQYNFGELGLRPEFVNKRLYLTSTPYTDWQFIDVRQSSIWHSFDVAHQSFLDANAVVSSGSGSIDIFDANMNLIGTQAFGVLSQPASEPILLQGGQFFMRVTGDTIIDSLSLDIVTPNVNVSGNQLVAVATAGHDDVVLELGETTHVLDINGLIYEFDANTVTDIHIGASSGNDSVTIVGTELNDRASVIGTNGKLTSSDYSVHTYSFDNTKFVGGGGYDYSEVYGSLGNDRLSSLPGDTTLTTPNNVHHVIDFDRVDAYGRGGWDYASLYGTNSADTFVSNDHLSLLQGDGHHAVAKGFERVDAFGRGGDDTAMMYDSSGNDTFVSTPDYALLSTGSRLSYTKGFEHNTAIFNSGGSGDRAIFTGLKQDDELHGEGSNANIATVAGRDDRALHVDHLFAYGADFDVDVDNFDGSVNINS